MDASARCKRSDCSLGAILAVTPRAIASPDWQHPVGRRVRLGGVARSAYRVRVASREIEAIARRAASCVTIIPASR